MRLGLPACVRHFRLISIIGEESIGQNEPAFLVALDVVGPLVKPSLGLGGGRGYQSGSGGGQHLLRGKRRRLERGFVLGWRRITSRHV